MKKGNGQGSISYEKDRNCYRAAIVDNNGKRVRKRFNTKQEAEEWLTIIRASIYTNTYVARTDYTLGEWIIEYIETYAKGFVRETTLNSYKTYLAHINDISGINLSDLNSIVLQKFFNNHFNDKNATARNCYVLLKAILKKAKNLGVIPNNPLEHVIVKYDKSKKIDVFSKEEIKRILDFTSQDKIYKKYYTMILLAITTGARLGEILGLKWENVYPTHIYINNALKLVKHKCVDGLPKTKTSIRNISIPQYVYSALQSIPKDNEYVFHTSKGTPYLLRSIDVIVWRAILNGAGVEYKKFHTLRHTHASYLLAEGLPLADISKRLGHKDITTTLNTYSHVIPHQQDEITGRILEIYGIAPTLPPT